MCKRSRVDTFHDEDNLSVLEVGELVEIIFACIDDFETAVAYTRVCKFFAGTIFGYYDRLRERKRLPVAWPLRGLSRAEFYKRSGFPDEVLDRWQQKTVACLLKVHLTLPDFSKGYGFVFPDGDMPCDKRQKIMDALMTKEEFRGILWPALLYVDLWMEAYMNKESTTDSLITFLHSRIKYSLKPEKVDAASLTVLMLVSKGYARLAPFVMRHLGLTIEKVERVFHFLNKKHMVYLDYTGGIGDQKMTCLLWISNQKDLENEGFGHYYYDIAGAWYSWPYGYDGLQKFLYSAWFIEQGLDYSSAMNFKIINDFLCMEHLSGISGKDHITRDALIKLLWRKYCGVQDFRRHLYSFFRNGNIYADVKNEDFRRDGFRFIFTDPTLLSTILQDVCHNYVDVSSDMSNRQFIIPLRALLFDSPDADVDMAWQQAKKKYSKFWVYEVVVTGHMVNSSYVDHNVRMRRVSQLSRKIDFSFPRDELCKRFMDCELGLSLFWLRIIMPDPAAQVRTIYDYVKFLYMMDAEGGSHDFKRSLARTLSMDRSKEMTECLFCVNRGSGCLICELNTQDARDKIMDWLFMSVDPQTAPIPSDT